MAWKPKTIAGKILKGIVIGGGAALALASGVGAIAGAAGGVGILAGAASGVKVVGKVVSSVIKTGAKVGGSVAKSATNLITGTTKEQRVLIRDQRAETREANQKLEVVDKLVKAGATVEQAASKAGVPLSQLGGLFGLPSAEDLAKGEKVYLVNDVEKSESEVKKSSLMGDGCSEAAPAAIMLLVTYIAGIGFVVYTLINTIL